MALPEHLKDLGITKELIEKSIDQFGSELTGIGLAAMIEVRSKLKFQTDFIKEVFPKADLDTTNNAIYWLTRKETK